MQYATRLVARQRRRPDARMCGGEVSSRSLPLTWSFDRLFGAGKQGWRHFDENVEFRPTRRSDYCAFMLMLAAWITFAHFSLSTFISVANSSGVVPTGSRPSAARRSVVSGSAMILVISRLSAAIISLGVRAGTSTPTQPSPSTSGQPASAMVGASGSPRDRLLLRIASARNLPSLTCGSADATAPKEIGVWPPTTEDIAGPLPLNGTCKRSRPSETRNCSPRRCDGVPSPGEAKLYLPGLARMSATRSLTVVAGTDGWTVSADAKVTASETGSKSL